MNKVETVKLNNGIEMPLEGFGVFQVPRPRRVRAGGVGRHRHRLPPDRHDGGLYERGGRGPCHRQVRRAREELFVTTKLWVQDASYEGAKQAIETSMKKLGLDYIDLYLIHQPMGDYIGAYRAMEEAYKAGKLKAIGVCNCYPQILADICETVEVKPAVDQVELHPFFQQENALALMKEYGIHPEAWGPFAEGNHGIFTHPVLTQIGQKYGKSAAQVALRWNVQRGVTVIPKSIHKERMEQNIDIWDFKLSGEDIAEIAKLDIGHSEIVDHSDPKFVQMLHQIKIHE